MVSTMQHDPEVARRLGLMRRRRQSLLLYCVRSVLFLSIGAPFTYIIYYMATNFSSSLSSARALRETGFADFRFVVEVYTVTVIMTLVSTYFLYWWLLISLNGSHFRGMLLKFLFRTAAALPASLVCLAIVAPLAPLGLAQPCLRNQLFVALLFSLSGLPTAGFLMGDVATLALSMNIPALETAFGTGSTAAEAMHAAILRRPGMMKYLVTISLFVSFRGIAEMGFLKAIVDQGKAVTLQTFIQNFYMSFQPNDLAVLGIAIFVAGFIGLFVALVGR